MTKKMSDMTQTHEDKTKPSRGRKNHQLGSANGMLVLFVVAMIATALVALLFGQKIGYQRGYHSSQSALSKNTDGEALSTEQVKELKRKNEILSNDVATAKQELAISLTNLDELRRIDEELKVNNRQLTQVNDVFTDFIADKGGMPLAVIGAKIEPLPEQAFEYRFDVAMVSRDGSSKTLTPKLTLLNDDSLV